MPVQRGLARDDGDPSGRMGSPGGSRSLPGFTLVEVLIVIILIGLLAWFVVPVFTGELERRRLSGSIDQLQNLIALTRAHAMNDGKRYRIRWPEGELYEQAEETEETLQPIIEVEKDPIEEPGVFTEVKELWARVEPLFDGVQCSEVRLGRPKTPEEELRERQEQERLEEVASGLDAMFEEDDKLDDMMGDDVDETATEEEKDPNRPAVVFEADGTVEWATVFLTNGRENEDGELQTWEIRIDGRTGKVGWRRTMTETEYEEVLAEKEEEQEERKIVRGREAGAR